jgi:hypothetical protein
MARQTRQTSQPLSRLPINAMSIPLTGLVNFVHTGQIDLNPPYQRGDVWTEDQRIALVYSWLVGATVPSITINDRRGTIWKDRATYDVSKTNVGIWSCIDGKQRLTTAVMWMDGSFAVPASWFPADCIDTTVATDDGPYVRYTGLTDRGQRWGTDRTLIPTGVGEFASLRDEAQIYLLLNGGGTPQSAADMDNAARIAIKE